jgi:hypothetical protein
MFVGASRKAQVTSLLNSLGLIAANRDPAMVVLVAAPGSGKTRIIQEFYRALAAGQRNPAYWPASLLDEVPDGSLSLTDLTASRKTVRYRGSFVPSSSARIPWLWIAPASGRLSDGSPAPAFDGLVSQFTPHVPAIMTRLDEAGEAGVVDQVPASRVLARRDAIRLAVADLVTGFDESSERPGRLAGLLGWLLPEGGNEPMSVILVLDDAHELDELTVDFVRELMASELPALVIATTWPEKVTAFSGQPLSPFSSYLAEAGGSGRIRQEWIGQLDDDDLIDYIVDQFPATDQKVAAALAARADHNPYALRLLLNTPRVSRSVRDGAITLDPREIADLNGRLDKLLEAHWEELPAGVRQVLVAAALLGQSFLDEVLEAGLRRYRPQAGLDEALSSSWIRQLGGQDRVLEFAERLRFDIAKGAGPYFLSDREREEIYAGALRSLRRLLPCEPDGTGRIVLLALHILLAREGAEDDLASAAASAAELAERARSEYRRLDGIEYYRQAITWVEATKSAPMQQLVDYLINYAALYRIQYGRAAGEPPAERAVQLADQHLSPDHEFRVQARCALVRARRRPEDPEAYASAWTLFAETQELLRRLESPSAEVIHDFRSVEGALMMSEGLFAQASVYYRSLAEFCEERFGLVHRHTLSALSDLGYCLHRSSGADEAIAVRRLVLERRVRRFNDAGHLQTMGAKNDLAHSLLATRNLRYLDEAEQLTEESITRKSRAFGFDGRSTRSSRSLRTRIWMARGLIAEAVGDTDTAARLFAQALDEAERVRDLRKDDERPGAYAVSVQRHGEVLACQRNPEAITVLDDALDIRESRIGERHTIWAVQDCAKSLWWAYHRLGRDVEAEAVARRYHLKGDAEDWMPSFVPDLDTGG